MITLIGIGMFHISQLIAAILSAMAIGMLILIAYVLIRSNGPFLLDWVWHWFTSSVKWILK